MDAANRDKEQQTILRNHFERNLMRIQQSCISEMEKFKSEAVTDNIQILYNKGLLDSFQNKDGIFEFFLTFTDKYLLGKYGTEIQTSDGVY